VSRPEYDAVLIYDGECPYCSVAATALKRLDDIAAISWYDDSVAPFLDAQFDAEPFAMFLVDPSEDAVYAGREAARELSDRAGMPGTLSGLVRDNYEKIASVVGLASGRGRDPDPYHDVYDLTEAARECYRDLSAAASRGPLVDA